MTETQVAPVLRDVRELSPIKRAERAGLVRVAADVRLPELAEFNSDPCLRHAASGGGELDPSCNDCGIALRAHQRVGAAWLYMAGKGLLADSVGSGKTAQAAAVLAMCKQTGELGDHNRAVVICKAAAVLQWTDQLRRFLPEIMVSAATGDREHRVERYLGPWEVLVISDRTFGSTKSRDGDVELLRQFSVGIVIADDLDAIRNPKTQTAKAVKKLADRASRVMILHATPLQKKLPELHSILMLIGGLPVFGTLSRFRRNFVKTGENSFWQRAMTCSTPNPCELHENVIKGCKDCRIGHLWSPPAKRCPVCGRPGYPDRTGRTVLRTVLVDVGIKNREEFRYLLSPFVLRRTEFEGAEYPSVQVNQVWLDLTAAQRERYEELRRGVLRRLRDGGEEITHAEAAAAYVRMWQVCSGLATLDDGRDVSAKLDWVIDKITGDLDGRKVVVFSHFRPNVAALSARLEREGLPVDRGHVLMWSQETDPEVRHERVRRFTEDPECRVLIGTSTIEQSLNLQAAGHLICIDQLRNPARMTQIVGRIRRQGSIHQTCFVHLLTARGTFEEMVLPKLAVEQHLSDTVFNEESDVFPESMSPRAMMALLAGED